MRIVAVPHLISNHPSSVQIADLYIHEEDLITIPVMDARVNERIKAQYEGSGDS